MLFKDFLHTAQYVNYAARPAADGSSRTDPLPVNPVTGDPASISDPTTWGDYQSAMSAVANQMAQYIAIVLTRAQQVTIVEVKDAVDPVTGDLTALGKDILATSHTYAEVPLSGSVLRLYYACPSPIGNCRKAGCNVALYDRDRFVPVSNNQVPDTPDELSADADELQAIYDKYIGNKSGKTKKDVFVHLGSYCRNKKAKDGTNEIIELTNFTVSPISKLIDDDGNISLLCNCVTCDGKVIRKTFETQDFISSTKFRTALNRGSIDLCFFGTDKNLEQVKDYIAAMDWPVIRGVKAIGIYLLSGGTAYGFADINGTINANGDTTCDMYQQPASAIISSSVAATKPIEASALASLARHLLEYNIEQKTVPVLSWIAAAWLKEPLRMMGVRFPHFYLVGEAGSGKSTTATTVIQPIFGTHDAKGAGQMTTFTLLRNAASSNTIPFIVDEYKPSKIESARVNALHNVLRDGYDGHQGVRGHADQSVTTYDITAPIVLIGEEAPNEPALRERAIQLLFCKKDLESCQLVSLQELQSRSNDLRALGRALLDTVLGLDPATIRQWYDAAQTQVAHDLPSRIQENLAVMITGQTLLDACLRRLGLGGWDAVFPVTLAKACDILDAATREYLLDGKANNISVVAATLEMMARMVDNNPDYYRDNYIRIDGAENAPHWTMTIALSQLYDEVGKYRRDHAITDEFVSQRQFMTMLSHSAYCVDKNKTVRIGNTPKRCYVLDLHKLSSDIDISGFIHS